MFFFFLCQHEVLPEFIPFSSEKFCENDAKAKPKTSYGSPASSSRSNNANYRRSDNNHSKQPVNGESYRSPHNTPGQSRDRESYNSPRKSRDQTPRSARRSRSPNKTRHEPIRYNQSPELTRRRSRSPPIRVRHDQMRYDNEQIEYSSRQLDRTSIERRISHSVFDRISSPPRRRLDRGSAESSNSQLTQFFRSVNGTRDFESPHETIVRLEHRQHILQVPRNRSPYETRRDFTEQPIDNDPFRSLRERLISAETHCVGLEATVRSYEREITKLRNIVNGLRDDFEIIIQSLR